RWEAALKTLAQAARRRIVSPERARHHRGVILYERSLAADRGGDGDRRGATALAAQAQALTPDLATPAAHHARLLLQERRTGRAAKAVERAWRSAPQPELAQIYGEIHHGEPVLARVKSFERLAAQNPGARESHMVLAEAALDAQLWGEARRHLEQALAARAPPPIGKPTSFPARARQGAGTGEGLVGPTPRLCLLMARLEEAENPDAARIREWLDRAVGAMPDPRYICASCGIESPEWRSLCPHCGSFDALAWGTPAWAASSAILAAAAEPRTTLVLTAPLPAGDAATG